MTPKQIRNLVDELGKLDQALLTLRSLSRRADAIRSELRSLCEDDPAEQSRIFQGSQYQAQVSPRRMERTITSMERTLQALGAEVFFAECSLPLATLERRLAAHEVAALVSEARTGPRSVTVAARALAKAA